VRVSVSIRDVLRAERIAERELARLADDALAICQEAAGLELASKSYQNRTGVLAGGTEAVMVGRSADGFTVVLKQGAFYGVYVQARGYSDFEQWAAYAGVGIDNRVKAIGRRLSRLSRL